MGLKLSELIGPACVVGALLGVEAGLDYWRQSSFDAEMRERNCSRFGAEGKRTHLFDGIQVYGAFWLCDDEMASRAEVRDD